MKYIELICSHNIQRVNFKDSKGNFQHMKKSLHTKPNIEILPSKIAELGNIETCQHGQGLFSSSFSSKVNSGTIFGLFQGNV